MSKVLHYEYTAPSGGGPTLLLIHPLGGDLHFWEPLVHLLAGKAGCLRCDLRSAGRSQQVGRPVTLEDHARDLEDLRLHLKLNQVIPVGCAIGAMTAAAYAARQPERCPALILSNPTDKTQPQARQMLGERARQVIEKGMAAILPDAVDKAFHGQPRDLRYQQYLDRFAAQDPVAYAQSILGILDADVTSDLQSLRCPALVVCATLDLLLPPNHAQAVHALVPGAQWARLEQAAHFAPLQQPELFAQLTLDFLGSKGLLATGLKTQ
jgi:pimeloyl-ACP methyl ester carboxylesterase